MARPRADGTPARAPKKCKLSEIYLKKLRPQRQAFAVWDSHQRGLAVVVQPTGHKSWKCIYPFQGRPRWYHIGAADAVSLGDARRLASRVMFQVAEGKDPAAERKAERGKGTFEELASRYVNEWARKENKSWRQAAKLVRGNLIARWGKLQASAISRSDVKVMMGSLASPTVANQTLAAASAIFTWAIREDILKANPCQQVERNKTKSRERVLSDSEIPKFWAAFDDFGLVVSSALKVILLTGQRPGEVSHMHRQHIEDGWWTLPGDPVPALGWPGTKNKTTHRIWLPEFSSGSDGRDGWGWVCVCQLARHCSGQAGQRHAGNLHQARHREGNAARLEAHPRHQDHWAGLWARGHEQGSEPQGGRHRRRL